MPKRCPKCEFFSPANEPQECPECGSALQFTMFTPEGFAPEAEQATEPAAGATSATPAWDTETAQYEIMELPPAVRLGQVFSGVVAFILLSRFGSHLAFALFLTGTGDTPPLFVMLCALGLTVIIFIASALFGGAVAGAWTVNWIPQGIGVGLGVLFIPLLLMLIISPTWIPLAVYLMLSLITSFFTVIGAYVGHKVVRPSRFIVG